MVSDMKTIKREIGDRGEKIALLFLKKNKYKILDTNFSTKTGEIDIICENKEYIVFVEVKTRNKDALASGVYAVGDFKQKHIIKTAHIYLSTHKSNKQPRFDIIEVESDANTSDYKVVNHIIDAFLQRGSYAVF